MMRRDYPFDTGGIFHPLACDQKDSHFSVIRKRKNNAPIISKRKSCKNERYFLLTEKSVNFKKKALAKKRPKLYPLKKSVIFIEK